MKKRNYILGGCSTAIKTDTPKEETIKMGAAKEPTKTPTKELITVERKIEWIEENNVELTPKKTIQDIDGNDVQVWDTENIQSYGKDGIEEELEARTKALADAENFDCNAYKTEMINKAQKEYDKIIDVKSVMGN